MSAAERRLARRVWEADYRHDRRKRRHRCRCCNRILTAGERALFVRLSRGTYAVHAEPCSAVADDGMTWRERFESWALEVRCPA